MTTTTSHPPISSSRGAGSLGIVAAVSGVISAHSGRSAAGPLPATGKASLLASSCSLDCAGGHALSAAFPQIL